MAAHTTHKTGHAAKSRTLALRQARASKRVPLATLTRSGHASLSKADAPALPTYTRGSF